MIATNASQVGTFPTKWIANMKNLRAILLWAVGMIPTASQAQEEDVSFKNQIKHLHFA
jgi:hypothetical protein